MEMLLLVLLGGALGVALGSQMSRQPPQITVIQVQPDELRNAHGGCAPVIVGVLIFLVLSWLVSILPQS